MGIYSLAMVRVYTLYIQFDFINKPANQQQEQCYTMAFKIYDINTNFKIKGAAANITDTLLILAFLEIFTTFLNLNCEENISHWIKIITSS